MTFSRPRRRTCLQPLPTSLPHTHLPRAWPKGGGGSGKPVPPGGKACPTRSFRVRRWQGRGQALTWRGGAEGLGSSILKPPSGGFQTLPKLHTVGTG